MSKPGPVMIEIDDETAAASPADAPPVPDAIPTGAAMQQVAAMTSRRGSRLGGWLGGALVAVFGFVLSVMVYDFAVAMIARSPILGWALTGILAFLAAIAGVIILREFAAFGRLRRIDRLQRQADEAVRQGDLQMSRDLATDMIRFYRGRDDTDRARATIRQRMDEVLDAETLLALTESSLLAPLDARAVQEIEAASRQVAVVTAIVPLALADVIAALTANLRMIRRIAEIYGGRAGTLGNWRLTRTVFTHLVATGAVAVGDDLIGSVAGGGVLSKLSRRFGEGVINGALTARVGVAAIEVCRPMPFDRETSPSVSGIVSRSLTGVFGRS